MTTQAAAPTIVTCQFQGPVMVVACNPTGLTMYAHGETVEQAQAGMEQRFVWTETTAADWEVGTFIKSDRPCRRKGMAVFVRQ
jgi:hypothetical protein